MDTHDILHAEEGYVVKHLKHMLIAELEHHAQAILSDLKSKHYSDIMLELIKVIPSSQVQMSDKFELVQQIITRYLGQSTIEGGVLQRLAVVMTLIVVRKHEEIVKTL